MCLPLAAIGAATGVLSSGLSYAGQRQQAKQQAAFQRQAQEAERQRFMQEQTSLRMRQAQEQEAVGRELEQVSRKSQAALARARVAGASVQALMDDYMRQEGAYRASILRQQEMGALATGLGLEQAGFATQQRMIGLSQPIDRPSPLGAVLGGIQSGLSGYRTGLDISSRMKTPTKAEG